MVANDEVRARRGRRAVLVAVALAIAVQAVLLLRLGGQPLAWVAPALSAVAICSTARRPVLALVLAAIAPLVIAAAGVDPTAIWSIGVFIAFLLTWESLPAVLVGPVIGAANLAATAWHQGGVSFDAPSPTVAGATALLGAAVGSSLRAQARYRRELEGRARDALAGRAAAVQQSVAEERLRIARDLHDGVGHQIAVVSMHLGSAEVRLPADAVDVRASLAAARVAVQEVLAETEGILRVLRIEHDPDMLAPHAEHGAVHRLVDAARSAGQLVDTELFGLDLPLPPEVSAAVFRIVQEALTNAAKHGEGPVSLRVTIDAEAARIEVVNFVRSAPDRRIVEVTGSSACANASRTSAAASTRTRTGRCSG
jgi:signal transduction histidine kinase